VDYDQTAIGYREWRYVKVERLKRQPRPRDRVGLDLAATPSARHRYLTGEGRTGVTGLVSEPGCFPLQKERIDPSDFLVTFRHGYSESEVICWECVVPLATG